MKAERNIRALDPNAPFQPTKAIMYASEQIENLDGEETFSAQVDLIEYKPDLSTMTHSKVNRYPASLIPQLLSGPVVDFKPSINDAVLNQLFQQKGYEIVPNETPGSI
jgi:hypothetical protein